MNRQRFTARRFGTPTLCNVERSWYRPYVVILPFGCRPACYGNSSSLKLASCLHVSGVSPLTFGLHVHRDTACVELIQLGFVELLILWFVAQTGFFPHLIVAIAYNVQLISAVRIIRSRSETSPCDQFIVAITGNFHLVSAMHVIRSRSETSPCDQLIVAITGNLHLVSAMHVIRSCSETSPCDQFIVAINWNTELVSAVHIVGSCFKTLSLWPQAIRMYFPGCSNWTGCSQVAAWNVVLSSVVNICAASSDSCKSFT
jgi:hypothetical protein